MERRAIQGYHTLGPLTLLLPLVGVRQFKDNTYKTAANTAQNTCIDACMHATCDETSLVPNKKNKRKIDRKIHLFCLLTVNCQRAKKEEKKKESELLQVSV